MADGIDGTMVQSHQGVGVGGGDGPVRIGKLKPLKKIEELREALFQKEGVDERGIRVMG